MFDNFLDAIMLCQMKVSQAKFAIERKAMKAYHVQIKLVKHFQVDFCNKVSSN